ncbi:hypothetical protein G210_0098 [Candida maltosa Xu316]|uniref:protein-tyrosine-phosphatase n=1 Tax=Candida maltosa (strain Xu316) TaxID=1245528 RepID=M3IRP5_CANMX|nr:hypothetical protein G210_0098 [Candida maltosa Xu316]
MTFTFPNNSNPFFKLQQPPITPTSTSSNSTTSTTLPLSTSPHYRKRQLHHHSSQQPKHKSLNDSISSITSNTSDLTIYESSILPTTNSNSNSNSTETLTDDKLSLLQPPPCTTSNHHKYNQSLDSNRTLVSLDENEENEHEHEKQQDIDLKSSIPQPPLPISPNDCYFSTSTPNSNSTSRPKLPTMQSLPHLKKQVTSPTLSFDLSLKNIKQEQSKRLNYIPSQNFRPQIEKLSDKIQYTIPTDIYQLCQNKENLVIDIRPFIEYSKNHIKSSLNICLPSTLLKRNNFSLVRSINSLPDYEKFKFTDFLNDANGSLIVYDTVDNSSNLFHICNKIITCPTFASHPNKKIYLIDSNLKQFNDLYPCLFESNDDNDNENNNNTTNNNNNNNNLLTPLIVPGSMRSNSTTDLSPYHKATPVSATANTPILSTNFTLPSNSKSCQNFKIRHNEELMDPLEENSAAFFKLNNIPSDHSQIPEWMKSTVLDCQGYPSTTKINNDFYLLEKLEQKRLLSALSLDGNVNNLTSPIDEAVPTISCGIEYGSKNRYKDIFLYDHSRMHLGAGNRDDISNYINASMVDPPPEFGGCPSKNYIATQGPLEETVGDFFKMVLKYNVSLIISLTDSIENGVRKCAPFWSSGLYNCNGESIKISVIHEAKVDDAIVVRNIVVKMNDITKTIHQIHLLNWMDHSVIESKSLLKLVKLKQDYLKTTTTDNPGATLVHCSAGCGRTGTFMVIDTIINYLQSAKQLNHDPIFEIVNHFRKARISMVQTLQQYYLVYDTILYYLLNNK